MAAKRKRILHPYPYYTQQPNEDVLAFVHRLIRNGSRAQTISKHTRMPAESVRYIMITNFYMVR